MFADYSEVKKKLTYTLCQIESGENYQLLKTILSQHRSEDL